MSLLTASGAKHPKKAPNELMIDLLDLLEENDCSEEVAVCVLIDAAFCLVQDKEQFLDFAKWWIENNYKEEEQE